MTTASQSRPAAGSRRRRSRRTGSPLWPVLFVGPLALGLGVFYLWPTVRTVWLSFMETGPFGGQTFTGLSNYEALFQDGELLTALANSGIYTLIALLGIPIAILIAVLLDVKGLRGRSLFRMLYFLPVVTMPAAVGMVWRLIYNGDSGILNQTLGVVGIDGPAWLTTPGIALIAIAAVGVWSALGTNIVIFLAGLQGIPPELKEAAALDGAGPVRTFFNVTLPLLSPSIFFVSVTNVIAALQVFDLVYMMMGKTNPALPSTRTIVYLFYDAGFIRQDPGLAAAIAVVLLLVILALTVIQFRLQRRWVHYG